MADRDPAVAKGETGAPSRSPMVVYTVNMSWFAMLYFEILKGVLFYFRCFSEVISM